MYILVVLAKFLVGKEWTENIMQKIVPFLAKFYGTNDSVLLIRSVSELVYYGTLILVIISMFFLPGYSGTKKSILFCFLYRNVIPSLILIKWINVSNINLTDILCDSLFISIISSDLVVSKMSGKDLHPWISLFAMVSVFNSFMILVIVVFYYVGIFWEVASYLHLPMFSTYINVYVDGGILFIFYFILFFIYLINFKCLVYDMLHFGHQNGIAFYSFYFVLFCFIFKIKAFQSALKFGSRLIVGVMSDESVMKYKRKPIMNTKERVASVKVCKGVDEVIEDAPLITDEKFLSDHNIHIVAHSTEYDTIDDKYYVVPRRLGITRVMPRTDGISTSELIKRVHEWYENNEKNKNK